MTGGGELHAPFSAAITNRLRNEKYLLCIGTPSGNAHRSRLAERIHWQWPVDWNLENLEKVYRTIGLEATKCRLTTR
jgi:hypothetical protein